MNFFRFYKAVFPSIEKHINFNLHQRQILFRKMSYCSWRNEEIYKDHFDKGVYVCSECGHKLFSSVCKFEHDTPWPAFTKTILPDSVTKVEEKGRGGAFKVKCGKCGNGLGHEFLKGGPDGISSRF